MGSLSIVTVSGRMVYIFVCSLVSRKDRMYVGKLQKEEYAVRAKVGVVVSSFCLFRIGYHIFSALTHPSYYTRDLFMFIFLQCHCLCLSFVKCCWLRYVYQHLPYCFFFYFIYSLHIFITKMPWTWNNFASSFLSFTVHPHSIHIREES